MSLHEGHLCLWFRARYSTDMAEHVVPVWEHLSVGKQAHSAFLMACGLYSARGWAIASPGHHHMSECRE